MSNEKTLSPTLVPGTNFQFCIQIGKTVPGTVQFLPFAFAVYMAVSAWFNAVSQEMPMCGE
jgi:hypothetical protein